MTTVAPPSAESTEPADAPGAAARVLAPTGLVDLSGVGMRQLWRLSRTVAPRLQDGFAVTMLLAVFAGAGRIIVPLVVQRSLDDRLRHIGLALAVGAVGVLVAGVSSYTLNLRLQRRVEDALAQMRRSGLARVHDMAAATADRTPSADLVARLTADLDQVTTFIQGGGIQFVTNGAQLVISSVLMVAYGWLLAVPVFVIAGVLLAAMVVVQRTIGARYDRARRDLARMQSVVAEAIVGAPVIRATGTDDRAAARMEQAVDRARHSLVRTLLPISTNGSLGEIAISTMSIAVMMLGVWWGTTGHPEQVRISSGQVVAVVFLVTLFVRPMQFLVQTLGEAQNALTGWRRALELVLTPAATVEGGAGLPEGPVSVDVRGLGVRYPGSGLVLRDIEVHIPAGARVAVVGRTGSGKSTFAKVLTRRVEVAQGEILLSGRPLGSIADEALARRVVILPQDPFLFAGTVRANIVLGTPDASEEEILDVLGRLGLAHWAAGLEKGLDTEVGMGGSRLSVGERQLVALARTALVDPDLIILDEATSGVDPATDVAVQRALGELTHGRTTIAIAHRMVTAETADRVLVFDDGRVVQSGHHHDLVHQPGPYAALVAAWNAR